VSGLTASDTYISIIDIVLVNDDNEGEPDIELHHWRLSEADLELFN